MKTYTVTKPRRMSKLPKQQERDSTTKIYHQRSPHRRFRKPSITSIDIFCVKFYVLMLHICFWKTTQLYPWMINKNACRFHSFFAT